MLKGVRHAKNTLDEILQEIILLLLTLVQRSDNDDNSGLPRSGKLAFDRNLRIFDQCAARGTIAKAKGMDFSPLHEEPDACY